MFQESKDIRERIGVPGTDAIPHQPSGMYQYVMQWAVSTHEALLVSELSTAVQHPRVVRNLMKAMVHRDFSEVTAVGEVAGIRGRWEWHAHNQLPKDRAYVLWTWVVMFGVANRDQPIARAIVTDCSTYQCWDTTEPASITRSARQQPTGYRMWQHEEVAAIAHIIDDTEVSEMALVTTIAQREDDDGGSSPHRIESEDVHTQYRKRMNQWTPKPSAECIDGIACLASAIQIVEGHTRAMGGMSEFVGAYLHYRVPGPEAPLWPRVEDEYNETWHELWQSPEPSDPQEIESEDEYEPEGE